MPTILADPKIGLPRHWIATVAIGEDHHAEWLRVAAPGIVRYAEKFGLGLAVFTEHLDSSSAPKHPSWQKLLIGREFENIDSDAAGIVVLDTDILANYRTGRNLFDGWNPEKIGMVSKRFGMPYGYEDVATRITFLRNRFIDPAYPLDSIWNFTLEEVYRHEGLEPVQDECCAGLFAFSPPAHSQFLSEVYGRYTDLKDSLALEQLQLNYHVQSEGLLQTLDYHFHTLWVYEMAVKYPFLYRPEYSENADLITDCVGASLLTSTFLHFAGAWNESAMTAHGTHFLERGWAGSLEDFGSYQGSGPKGRARGRIIPSPRRSQHV